MSRRPRLTNYKTYPGSVKWKWNVSRMRLRDRSGITLPASHILLNHKRVPRPTTPQLPQPLWRRQRVSVVSQPQVRLADQVEHQGSPVPFGTLNLTWTHLQHQRRHLRNQKTDHSVHQVLNGISKTTLIWTRTSRLDNHHCSSQIQSLGLTSGPTLSMRSTEKIQREMNCQESSIVLALRKG